MAQVGRLFLIIGFIFLGLGLLFSFFHRLNLPFLGKLPGDIFIQKNNFSFYFPLTTCIVLSLVVSLIFIFLNKK